MTRPGILVALACVLALGSSLAEASAVEPRLAGFGEYRPGPAPCVGDEQRADIEARIRASASRVAPRSGSAQGAQAVSFAWPLRQAGLPDPGYHGVSNFVDHEPGFPGMLRDYNCGARSYDLAGGYNHSGTDVFLWPFAWLKMASSEVEVVAAAPGTIVLRDDGYFDQNCGFGGGNWNAVYVQHADGSVAWYGHLKNGSVTPKLPGETVATGEYLGVVGSSGNSTAPHLHFEVRDAANNLIDPYAGPCNPTTASSWWTVQRPYYDSAVNRILTHDAPPVFPPCPQIETPNDEKYFVPGQTVYFAAYYRDQLAGQVSDYRVYDAASVLRASWSHSSGAAHYAASYWYWWFSLPAGAPGWWRFEVDFQGSTTTRPFHVASPLAAGDAAASAFRLAATSPNPTRAGASFDFRIPERAWTRLALFDGQGRSVAILAEGQLDAGAHRAAWDGRLASGARAAPGLYFARLESGGRTASRKLVVAD